MWAKCNERTRWRCGPGACTGTTRRHGARRCGHGTNWHSIGNVETPITRYARSADGTFVAYQTFGSGEDVLVIMPFISHLELFWEDPDVGGMLRGLADPPA